MKLNAVSRDVQNKTGEIVSREFGFLPQKVETPKLEDYQISQAGPSQSIEQEKAFILSSAYKVNSR